MLQIHHNPLPSNPKGKTIVRWRKKILNLLWKYDLSRNKSSHIFYNNFFTTQILVGDENLRRISLCWCFHWKWKKEKGEKGEIVHTPVWRNRVCRERIFISTRKKFVWLWRGDDDKKCLLSRFFNLSHFVLVCYSRWCPFILLLFVCFVSSQLNYLLIELKQRYYKMFFLLTIYITDILNRTIDLESSQIF